MRTAQPEELEVVGSTNVRFPLCHKFVEEKKKQQCSKSKLRCLAACQKNKTAPHVNEDHVFHTMPENAK